MCVTRTVAPFSPGSIAICSGYRRIHLAMFESNGRCGCGGRGERGKVPSPIVAFGSMCSFVRSGTLSHREGRTSMCVLTRKLVSKGMITARGISPSHHPSELLL